MAKTLKCKACGNPVSTKAKACPQCGEPANRTSIVTWAVLILIIAMVITAAINPTPPPDPAQAAATAEQKAREKAARAARKAESDKENFAFSYCGQILKTSLRDPKSLDWDRAQSRTTKIDGGYEIARRYSANNAFGGRVQGVIICRISDTGGLISKEIVEL
jgi:RNA polymerase subunit RPABC4/transcription elongation factor Spt4